MLRRARVLMGSRLVPWTVKIANAKQRSQTSPVASAEWVDALPVDWEGALTPAPRLESLGQASFNRSRTVDISG